METALEIEARAPPTTMADEQSKGKRILTLLMKYIFSHVGLFLLVAGYCVGGAYLFQHLEMQLVTDAIAVNSNVSKQIEKDRDDLANKLWMYKWANDYNDTVDQLLSAYQAEVASAIQGNGYNGGPMELTDFSNGWAFPSALLFTITIVTTIGYGQITPKTDMGQLTVIFYAIIGVPLMLMFLANIGEVMARFFRLAYGRGCCYFCWKKRKANYEINRQRIRDIREGRVAKNAWMNDAVLDEHGKPKFASDDDLKKPSELDDGMTHSRRRQTARSRESSPNGKRDPETLEELRKGEGTEGIKGQNEEAAYNIYEDIEDPDEEVINVPISLTLVIIAAYLFIGAVLFAAWNGWTWITGAYFSFVTLSTIGFGDLIPGWNEVGTTIGNIKMAVSCFYIVFGLAVVSMSFNLMMEEMIAKFQWLGRKLGIIDDANKKNLPDDKRPLMENEEEIKEKNAVKEFKEKPGTPRPSSGLASAPDKFKEGEEKAAEEGKNALKEGENRATNATSHV